MGSYLQSSQRAQVVQLLRDGTSTHKICCVSQHILKSRRRLHQESGAQQWESINLATRLASVYFCEVHYHSDKKWPPAHHRCTSLWQGHQKVTPRGWYKGQALCSSIGIWQKTPGLTGSTLVPCCIHRWDQVRTKHWWQVWKSLEMPRWMLWFLSGEHILAGSHRPPCHSQLDPHCC